MPLMPEVQPPPGFERLDALVRRVDRVLWAGRDGRNAGWRWLYLRPWQRLLAHIGFTRREDVRRINAYVADAVQKLAAKIDAQAFFIPFTDQEWKRSLYVPVETDDGDRVYKRPDGTPFYSVRRGFLARKPARYVVKGGDGEEGG